MQIADTAAPAAAPKVRKPRKTFAQQMAELKEKQVKMLEGAARKIAKADKEHNPQLAEAATALEGMKRVQKVLNKFREATGNPGLTLDEAISALSSELAAAAPELLAKLGIAA